MAVITCDTTICWGTSGTGGIADETEHRAAPLAVSVNEAARLLSVSRVTIYRAIWRGELKAMKIGARTLIPYKELEAFLERGLGGRR